MVKNCIITEAMSQQEISGATVEIEVSLDLDVGLRNEWVQVEIVGAYNIRLLALVSLHARQANLQNCELLSRLLGFCVSITQGEVLIPSCGNTREFQVKSNEGRIRDVLKNARELVMEIGLRNLHGCRECNNGMLCQGNL